MVDQLFFAKSLQYYKRREVQEAILRHATNREISPRYGEGFGKRPDILSYPTDIIEFVKRKATSFHASEERWDNPLSIKTGASRKEMNELRTGWDLVLDIDAKDWGISRLTAWLFIEVLKYHGIRSISCKFSGNKGWHIGVPFESFPESVWDDAAKADVPTKDLFPELPRAVAGFMLEFMSQAENGMITINGDSIIFGWREPTGDLSKERITYKLSQFAQITGKQQHELMESFCPSCNKLVREDEEKYRLICVNPVCGHPEERRYTKEEKDGLDIREQQCPKCKSVREFLLLSKKACAHDPKAYQRRFKLTEIIQIDTVLLASRHLYRMAYSLHEKSGLASVVVDPSEALHFDKAKADPKTISLEKTFLDTSVTVPGEASGLALKAWQWQQAKDQQNERRMHLTAFEGPTEAVGEEHFPPCMKKILGGLVDGKKRAMFAITNFLGVAGWTNEAIEKRLYEWNEQNAKIGEPLREVNIKGHMHGVRMKKERIMPPSCKSFYQELGVCNPDEFCSRIKNPGQYAIRHAMLGKKPIKREKKEAADKTTEE
jgi:hypothetical protein